MGSAKELAEAALTLSPEERVELVHKITESLDQAIDPGVDKAWADVAVRRKAEIESGNVAMIDGDEAVRAARASLRNAD